MAALKTDCQYKQNEMQCSGRLVLKCLRRRDETISPFYFIDYTEWKINEKFYRYINIKENVDLNLFRQLLDGLYEVNYKL